MTHSSWQRGMIHMDFPSPGPGSSSRMLLKHQLQSHWSSPSSLMHHLENERLGSSFQNEYLYRRTCTHSRINNGWERSLLHMLSYIYAHQTQHRNLLILTYTAHSRGVEFKVWWAVAVVATRDVDTHSINTDGWVCTLVDIWQRKTKQSNRFLPLHNKLSVVTVWWLFVTTAKRRAATLRGVSGS